MVSIIILSYNTSELLMKCLESIHTATKGKDVEVIVVDNASSDDSVKKVKNFSRSDRDPEWQRPSGQISNFKLIENDKNLGFAKGCNIGAENAKGEYLLFLNSDATLTQDALTKLIDGFSFNSKVSIVGGQLVNTDRTMQRSYGRFYDLWQVIKMLARGESLNLHSKQKKHAVDWVSGGCMMIKREVFEKLGGFDEQIFMYMEDMELCFRNKKAGYMVITVPEAQVIHIGQGSSNKGFAVIHIFKGLRYFYKKHKSSLEYMILNVLLYGKAISGIILGFLTNNSSLRKTYQQTI